MNTSFLRTFLTLADTGSFYRAQAVLGMSPSSLKHQLDALEAELGFKLFSRTHAGLALTDAGRRFSAVARQTLDALDRAVEDIRAEAGPQTVDIRYARSQVGDYAYASILARYRREHPEVAVSLEQVDALPVAGRSNVFLGQVDPAATGTVARRIASVPVLAYVLPGHPLAERESVTPDDLRPFELMAPGPYYVARMSAGLRAVLEGRGYAPYDINRTDPVRATEGLRGTRVWLAIGRNRFFEGVLASMPVAGESVDYNVYVRPDAYDHVTEYVDFLVRGYADTGQAARGFGR